MSSASLGDVDKLSGPQADLGDMDESEITVGGFVVGGRQPWGILGLVEAAFDPVAQGVYCGIDGQVAFISRENRTFARVEQSYYQIEA